MSRPEDKSRDRRNDPDWDEKRMELTEHLGELRTRLMRSILYLILGAVLMYQVAQPVYDFLSRPLNKGIERKVEEKEQAFLDKQGRFVLPRLTGEYAKDVPVLQAALEHVLKMESAPKAPPLGLSFHTFYGPFMLKLKLSIIMGFMLMTPLILWELGAFVAPALTPSERRPLRLLIPVSALLMVAGVCVAYYTMFYAMTWFLGYLNDFPQNTSLLQDPEDYVMFFVKMMAAFGVCFQLPVILMGGAFLGLVTSKGLVKNWRLGLLIPALGGLFIPTNDFVSMALIATCLFVLYFGSIWLVKIVERMKARSA